MKIGFKSDMGLAVMMFPPIAWTRRKTEQTDERTAKYMKEYWPGLCKDWSRLICRFSKICQQNTGASKLQELLETKNRNFCPGLNIAMQVLWTESVAKFQLIHDMANQGWNDQPLTYALEVRTPTLLICCPANHCNISCIAEKILVLCSGTEKG